ncbi:ribosome-associated translation inhibitor RaiA [Hathewaya histolytica]|uniref:Ribosome hibernation promoting factor n=1 Tax=Hathewaya histolytica TaxID=1498 RepID=A0A4U9RSW1_HATHI|nr:ribosome-associated translation inhibitor RaiA [Hathewaya histolytica]VTQ94053.1 SSU ribosomal protein S30P [Hathewaya histolytica]
MKVKFTGKNIEITEALKEVISNKLLKLDKYFKQEVEAHSVLSVQKELHNFELTIPFKGGILRAEEESEDMYKSVDLVLDKIERQIRKQKTKLQRKLQGESLAFSFIKEEKHPKEEPKIVKTKKFAMKPMSSEEAMLQMELLGHNFFMYMDGDTSEVNVIYKRKDGNYGLIEPEF